MMSRSNTREKTVTTISDELTSITDHLRGALGRGDFDAIVELQASLRPLFDRLEGLLRATGTRLTAEEVVTFDALSLVLRDVEAAGLDVVANA
jgi:hypothetical protein